MKYDLMLNLAYVEKIDIYVPNFGHFTKLIRNLL